MSDVTVPDESREVVRRDPREWVRKYDELAKRFEETLPAHVPPDRFHRVVKAALAGSPDLQNAVVDPRSLLGFMRSVTLCAADGLIPDGREAVLLPYWSNKQQRYEISYIPMIRGLLKLARQSREIRSVSAHVVYERDTWRYELGDAESITHVPYEGEDRGKPLRAYAIVHMVDGGIHREVIPARDILKIKNAAFKASPWHGPHEMEMWRKTALRRALKYCPLSATLPEHLFADEDEPQEAAPAMSLQDRLAEARKALPPAEPEPEAQEPAKPATDPDPEPQAEPVDLASADEPVDAIPTAEVEIADLSALPALVTPLGSFPGPKAAMDFANRFVRGLRAIGDEATAYRWARAHTEWIAKASEAAEAAAMLIRQGIEEAGLSYEEVIG